MWSFHLLKFCISVFLWSSSPPSPRSIVCSLNVFSLRTPPSRNHVICLSADAGAVNKQHVFHVHISPGPPPPPPHPPPHPPSRRLLSSGLLLLILRHDPQPHPPPPLSFLDLAFIPRLTVDSSHFAFSSIALLYNLLLDYDFSFFPLDKRANSYYPN